MQIRARALLLTLGMQQPVSRSRTRRSHPAAHLIASYRIRHIDMRTQRAASAAHSHTRYLYEHTQHHPSITHPRPALWAIEPGLKPASVVSIIINVSIRRAPGITRLGGSAPAHDTDATAANISAHFGKFAAAPAVAAPPLRLAPQQHGPPSDSHHFRRRNGQTPGDCDLRNSHRGGVRSTWPR